MKVRKDRRIIAVDIDVRMIRISLVICALFITLSGIAQAIPESEIILYKKLRYAGVNVNTHGYGGTLTFGKFRGARKVRLLTTDLLFVKHEKEVKSRGQNPSGRSFFYGKQNSFIALRTTFGQKYIVAEKLRRSGVQVAYNWQAGPVFGFTKPVYLEIINPDSQTGLPLIERFDVDKHYINDIEGRASALRGMGELKFYPGISAKFALSFEYSNEQERLKGLETGISVDAFAQRIPIMADKVLKADMSNPKNHQFFICLYLNLFFGTKYDQR